jgi:hypothetical protein
VSCIYVFYTNWEIYIDEKRNFMDSARTAVGIQYELQLNLENLLGHFLDSITFFTPKGPRAILLTLGMCM